jgi:hypothetical protein
MLICLLLFVVRSGHPLRLRYIILFGAVSSVSLGLYFGLRKMFVSGGWEQVTAVLPSPPTIGKNLVMYLAALVNPVDIVLANEWFDTPLPSEITLNSSRLFAIGVFGLVIISAIAVYVIRRAGDNFFASHKFSREPILLLVCGIGAPLLPVLAFSSHPSETYLYLSVGFYSLLLTYIIAKLVGQTRTPNYAFYVPVVVLAIGFSTATWVRNERVSECGRTVYRILYSLPDYVLRNGSGSVAFANLPGEKATRRYGFYGFRGVDTIGDGLAADGAVTHALQLVYLNKSLIGKVVNARELSFICARSSESPNICAFVHWDGRLEMCCQSTAHLPAL